MRRGEAYLAVVVIAPCNEWCRGGYRHWLSLFISLDRNREGMQSWQLGVNYRLRRNLH